MAANANPWNDFQHKYAGFNLSRQDFSRLYGWRVRETLEKANPPVPVARIVQLEKKPLLLDSPCTLCKRKDIRELSGGDNFCNLCGGRLRVPDPAEEVDTAEKVDEAGETGASSSGHKTTRGRRAGKRVQRSWARKDRDAAEEFGKTEETIASSIGCPCADCVNGKPPRDPESPSQFDEDVMALHKVYEYHNYDSLDYDY